MIYRTGKIERHGKCNPQIYNALLYTQEYSRTSKKLEKLGYKLNNGKWMGKYLATFRIKETKEWRYVASPEWDLQNNPDIGNSIDCGTNEVLFLSLAALREDSHKHQWHTCIRNHLTQRMNEYHVGDWNICVHDKLSSNTCWRKTTVKELIERFKD